MRQSVKQNDVLGKVAIDDALGISLALPYVALVVESGDKLDAVIVFNGFDKHNVDMSAVIINPVGIACAREIGRYVFDVLRVKRVTCLTLSSNIRAIERLRKFGFECEGLLRDRFPQGDALIFGLLASRQKLLRLSPNEPATGA